MVCFMALTGPCKHFGAEKTGKWRTDPDVPNDQKTHADGFCVKCYTRWRKTKKPKLGKIVLLMGRKRVDLRVKNGNHNDRDLNQTT